MKQCSVHRLTYFALFCLKSNRAVLVDKTRLTKLTEIDVGNIRPLHPHTVNMLPHTERKTQRKTDRTKITTTIMEIKSNNTQINI